MLICRSGCRGSPRRGRKGLSFICRLAFLEEQSDRQAFLEFALKALLYKPPLTRYQAPAPSLLRMPQQNSTEGAQGLQGNPLLQGGTQDQQNLQPTIPSSVSLAQSQRTLEDATESYSCQIHYLSMTQPIIACSLFCGLLH